VHHSPFPLTIGRPSLLACPFSGEQRLSIPQEIRYWQLEFLPGTSPRQPEPWHGREGSGRGPQCRAPSPQRTDRWRASMSWCDEAVRQMSERPGEQWIWKGDWPVLPNERSSAFRQAACSSAYDAEAVPLSYRRCSAGAPAATHRRVPESDARKTLPPFAYRCFRPIESQPSAFKGSVLAED
jgi:hypothetical protein